MKKNISSKQWDDRIWGGVYGTFAEASEEEGVFEDSVWVKKQVARLTYATEQNRLSGTISEIAQTTDYALPIVATAIAQSHQTLTILDFGGGLANSFFPLVAMLPVDQGLQFVVVENKSICDEGKNLFRNEKRLSFRTELPGDEKFDIIHAGSSFHYVDDWIALLLLFAGLRPQYMIFADLPAGDIETFVTIQNYYGRKIPVRFWNLVEFIGRVEELGFRLVMRARYHSNYLPVMSVFDQEHRLNHFSQLVFRRQE